MKAINKIDVHHHIFPKEYVDALKNAGVKYSMSVDFPKWTPEASLKQMDKNGIKIAISSITAPGVYFEGIEFPEGFSEKLARMTNEAIADTREKYPERFGGFATIPLLNIQNAMEELTYALDTLKLNGVYLMTNYKGKYLGDESFDPFFKELDRRKAIVVIHPTDPGLEFDTGLEMPHALIEAPFDTTRAVANLMYNGTLDKHTNITYILAHGGGTIPFLAWRLAGIEYGQKDKRPPVIRAMYDFLVKGKPDKGLRYLKKMYYDTAVVSGNYAVNTLKAFAGSKNIVFGTDLYINKLASIVTKNLYKDGEFTDEEYNDVSYKNCLKLFPALQKFY